MGYTEVMALFVEQNSNRSKLQEKLAAELREKAKRSSLSEGEGAKLPDGVEDSAYMKDTKKTTSLAWVWAVIALAGTAAVIWLVFMNATR